MAASTATVTLEGSGSLSKYLEDLLKNTSELNKVTEKQTKAYEGLNKVGKDTTSFSADLLKNTKELYEVTRDLSRGTKDTFTFLTDTADNTVKLNDALDEASTGLGGFGLKFVGLKDDVIRLNSVIDKPAGHFRDIAEAQGATAKAFVILDKTSKPIVSVLDTLSNQLEKAEKGFKNAEVNIASFSTTLVNTGAKGLTFFSQTFDNLSENIAKSGLLGRVFAGTFSGVAKTLEDGAKSAEKFGKSINPDQFVKVDAAGEKLAGTLDRTGRGIDRLATGVKLADAVGDITRFTLGIKESAETLGEDLTSGINQSANAAKVALPLYLQMNSRLQLISGAASAVATVTGNQLAGAIGLVGGKLSALAVGAGTFVTIGKAAADAYLQTKGLNDTFDVMQRMGIDTTAANIAFQFGLVGERLLFSSQAAKEFGKTAITAFSQLEDASAFVTTLGSGASFQFGEYEAGVESISAAMSNLVSGPLQNTVTSLEATNALYNSLSAGVGIAADGTVNLGEANDFLTASLKLASGTGADTAQTLELLAKTSKVYGLSNSEAATTASKLYQIVEQGIVTFPQLTSQLGRTLSVAKATGVGIDEASGSIAALTKVMSADDAQTGLASLLQSIAGQGEQAQNALKELGIRFDVNTIKTKGLIASLNDLYVATGGNASALKEIIPDALGFQTALTLMTSASKDAAKVTEDISNAGGEMLDNVFEARQQSTIQQFSMIMNGFNEVLIDFGRRALPAIQPGVDFLETLLGILQGLPEPIKAIIGGVVLFQTTLSNVGGGLLSFGLSIAQIVASLTAFRLVSKLISGNLGKEFAVLREINADGIDLAGTILRLIGLNEGFDAATATANNTLKQQKDILKQLSNQDINFDGLIESSRGLDSALKNTRDKVKETKDRLDVLKQTDSLVDVSKTEKELQKLERLEKKITTFKKRISGTRTDLFADLQGSIDKVLSSAEVTIEEKRKTLKAKLGNYFNTFGETGQRYKAEIDAVFAEIISDESLDTAAKIEKINQKFKALGQDVSPEIRKNFDKVQVEITEAVQRLDGNFTGELSKVKDKVNNTFSNLLDSKAGSAVRAGMDDLADKFKIGGTKINAEIEKVLADPATTIETKIYQINSMFDKIAAGSPQAIRSNIEKIKVVVTDNLLNIAVEVEEARNKIEGETEQLSLALGDIGNSDTQNQAIKNLQDLKAKSEIQINSLRTLADTSVVQLNLDLESVGGPSVDNRIQKNLINIENKVKQSGAKLEKVALQSVEKVNNSLAKVGDTQGKGLNKLQGTFSSIGDLVSNFVPGVGSAMMVLRDFGDVAQSAGLDGEVLVNTQKRLFKENIGLDLSMGRLNKSTLGFGKATKGAAGGVGFLTKAGTALAGVAKVIASGLAAAGVALKSLLVTLGPFVAIAGIAVAALYALHNVVKLLIPAYARAADGNQKLAASMARTDEQVDKSTKKIKEMTQTLEEMSLVSPTALESFATDAEKAALADLANSTISGLTGATDAEITKLREAVIKAIVPEEKAFIQGWRAPIVSLLEFVNGAIANISFTIMKLPLQLGKAGAEGLSTLLEKVPIIGGVLTKTASAFERALFGVRKEQSEFNKENRNFFNNIRENIQSGIAAPAREAALQSREAVTGLLLETNKLNSAYKEGGVAFGESQEIVKKASEEQRSLRAGELQQILADEQELNTKAREEIQKNIEAKQKELDAAKDPVVKEELQSQIDALQTRNTELENGLKLQQQYLQNVNAILNARDNNRAETGEEALVERTQQLFNDLSEEGKKTFLELGDLAVDAEGQITGVAGNLVNSSQRRAEAAFQGARAGFIQTIEDIDDPTKGINADKIATDLFSVLESVDAKVAEGVIDFEAGEKLKEQYANLEVEITDQFGNIQSGQAKEFLLPQQLKALEEAGLESIRTVAERGIKIREEATKKLSNLEQQNLLSGVEAAKQQAQLNTEIGDFRIQAEERVLEKIRQRDGDSAESTKQQVRIVEQLKSDLALQGFNDRKKILDEELSALQRQKDNEIKLIENAAEKEKSVLELRTKSINLEQQAIQAQQELSTAIANLETTNLQNKLKFTGEIVEKAEIELQLAQDRQSTLAAEQEFERQNLELQQELNKLGFEREKIELRVQAAQLSTQKILAQAKLDQADQLNLSEAERTAFQLQVDAITQQVDLNNQQQSQLVKQGETQEIINKKQRESLGIRQEAAKQTSAADVELAKLELVNAGYEKQKEILRNNAREVEVGSEEQLQNLKSQEDVLNAQTTVYQKQLDIIKQTQDISQKMFDIAKATSMSGFRQRRIEKEAAQERLKNLNAIQKIEEVNLQIQQQQRDLALVRKEIELDVAEAKQVASLAEAQAEQARLEADPRATDEQRRAAALGVQAQQTGLQGIASQREALGIEKALNDFVAIQERQQQSREFGVQQLEAEQAVASTTRTRSDDRRISNRALTQGRESADEVESLINQFQTTQRVNGILSSQGLPALQTSGGRSNQLNQATQSVGSVTQGSNQNMMQLGGEVKISLELKGEAAKLDKAVLEKAVTDGIYQGMNQLFDYSLNRR